MSISSSDSIRSGSRSNNKISNKHNRDIIINDSSNYDGACDDDWDSSSNDRSVRINDVANNSTGNNHL